MSVDFAPRDKSPAIKLGDFLFKYRNAVFPLLIVALFVAFRPIEWTFDGEPYEQSKNLVAIFVVLTGLGLRAAVIGLAYIKRGGVDKKVYADRLVSEGFFAACRNPLYLGNMIVYLGVFLMHGNPLLILLGTGLFLAIYSAIIAAEEHYLLGRFGEVYRDYMASVPRWAIRIAVLRTEMRRMRFDWRLVLAKDYSTVASASMALLAAEVLESVRAHEAADLSARAPIYAGLALLVGVATLGIRHWKKTRPRPA